MQVIIFTEFCFIGPRSVVHWQVVPSTTHLAKYYSAAVTNALSMSQGVAFGRDVLPQEYRGLLEKRGVGDVDESNKELFKKVIGSESAGNGASEAGSSNKILRVILLNNERMIISVQGPIGTLLGYTMPEPFGHFLQLRLLGLNRIESSVVPRSSYVLFLLGVLCFIRNNLLKE